MALQGPRNTDPRYDELAWPGLVCYGIYREGGRCGGGSPSLPVVLAAGSWTPMRSTCGPQPCEDLCVTPPTCLRGLLQPMT